MSFLHYALIGGILASIACGIIGPFVVVKKISYISGGIAHTVLAGLGIAYFLGGDPIVGALIAALIAALIIGWVSISAKKYEDTIISVLWALGMAVGIIFITKTPGYNVDLMSYLFGNILFISSTDLYLLLALDLVIIVTVFCLYKQFLAVCFDAEFARLRGLPVKFYYLLLLCLMALAVVSLIQVVGLILVMALLTIPAAIARQYVSSIAKMMLVSIILGAVFTAVGLSLSYITNLPTGATIILLAGVAFLCSTALKSVINEVAHAK
ncbi:MAG: metal ABC transporter permease [Gammaproteobacteria bacterium]|nr:metal ABC transporter permease [Gammaproteobacteria bacterium]